VPASDRSQDRIYVAILLVVAQMVDEVGRASDVMQDTVWSRILRLLATNIMST